MSDEIRLDEALQTLARTAAPVPPAGFMDTVWQRAGVLEAQATHRQRLTLFFGVFVIGLGAGFGITSGPEKSRTSPYQLVAGADLSPASLLHVEQ
ncbi:hypothetical protein MB02_14390 [Croceicoccus estronivorus]|uniref:hypothetical protein n=1 Tax=Croceicoccus estronivorus TaxID=1172626 RepID=UPI000830AF69|nr:hypothetical protein [Croceicoccus estronivorus]OCC22951.1 hypothetical protein MB02_14390 [Croceicoccus estronivorus]